MQSGVMSSKQSALQVCFSIISVGLGQDHMLYYMWCKCNCNRTFIKCRSLIQRCS